MNGEQLLSYLNTAARANREFHQRYGDAQLMEDAVAEISFLQEANTRLEREREELENTIEQQSNVLTNSADRRLEACRDRDDARDYSGKTVEAYFQLSKAVREHCDSKVPNRDRDLLRQLGEIRRSWLIATHQNQGT